VTSGLTETAIEVGTVLLYAAVSGVLTYAGVLSEQSAIEAFGSEPTPLAVWFLLLGAAAIYGGVVLVGRELFAARLLALLR